MLSRRCNANYGKQRQECGKQQRRKEKADCGNSPQLAESVRLATPLARFGKAVRTASKQRVGSSNLPGRTTFSIKTHFSGLLADRGAPRLNVGLILRGSGQPGPRENSYD